jgi:uncharacterized protein YsxB (DUF464 family)
MIRVLIHRDPSNRSIRAFSAEGHADYAKRGEDIVCAGVSAVTVGTVNAAEKLLGIELPSRMNNGFLQSTVPEGLDAEQEAKLQLLLESMVAMLETIEDTYGSHIALEEHQSRRR